MKQSRRHELKTNELSVLLKQMYEKLQQYANYLIVGLVAAVVVLIMIFIMQHNRIAAQQLAWQTYSDLRRGDVIRDPGLIDQAAALAAERAGDAVLEPLAMELEADLAYQLAVGPESKLNDEEKTQRLETAKQRYEQVLSQFPSSTEATARIQMGLAATEESLFTFGRSKLETIRSLYQKVLDAEPNAFQAAAAKQLETLEQRTQELQIIATRPAEAPAPATTPAD